MRNIADGQKLDKTHIFSVILTHLCAHPNVELTFYLTMALASSMQKLICSLRILFATYNNLHHFESKKKNQFVFVFKKLENCSVI